MLYQDFMSKFPPSNTGEFTEKNGNNLKVTWMMFQELNNSSIPTHANLEIDLESLSLAFSIEYPHGKKVGHATVKNDIVEFHNDESKQFFSSFSEKIELWKNSLTKSSLH